ncbi:hypothetical protein [Pseudomonas sp. MWU12-2323]|uniref:hypothetical protein n=1 Tax=Pseudomonas sp. MWU12-2323 TaxID=2651296 RepID=UPI00128D9E2F|nr:hypothetical protein [Pseudomonas sp. MWU12-2323]MPQ71442.1 hypothetical protein [Pseudomonas sp. MWU12-2323]
MGRTLPPFRPVTLTELRRIWTKYPDQDIRRLTLEVERYRRLVAEIHHLSTTIHQAWREEVGGNLVALHLLKQALYSERERMGLREFS